MRTCFIRYLEVWPRKCSIFETKETPVKLEGGFMYGCLDC